MANSLMGMMGGASAAAPAMGMQNNFLQAVQSAKKMMGMLQGVSNPQQILMTAAQQSPELGAVMQMVGSRNPREVFYEQCKKSGMDPNTIINALRG